MPSCVLAYSGGLDTSVILGWLQEEGYDVHCVYVDLGQPCEDRQAVLEKARNAAQVARIVDAREELCRDFAFPVLQWQAKYEGIYLLGTSIARPLISKVCLDVAREVGADAYAHGATGKGNDQCRFQLAAEAPIHGENNRPLADRKISPAFRPHGNDRFLRAEEDSGQGVVSKPYSSDENCLHISYEAGQFGRPDGQRRRVGRFWHDGLPQQAPTTPKLSRSALSPEFPCRQRAAAPAFEIVEELNQIGGRNGVGRIDMVENRFVGMKSRGVYESPGMTLLYAGHRVVEQLTLDRDLMHLRDRLAPEVAEMVYYGFLVSRQVRCAIGLYSSGAQKPVTGEVTLSLYKGNVDVASRSSPRASTTKESPAWKGAAGTIKPTPRGLRIQGRPVARAGTRQSSQSAFVEEPESVVDRITSDRFRDGKKSLAAAR